MEKLKLSKLGLAVLIAGSVSLVSCSGGGGGNGEEDGGGGETSEITVMTDADWLAYQDSNGVWHRLTNISSTANGSTMKTYSFQVQDKYGVAIYCEDSEEGTIYQFTKDELTQIKYICVEPNINTYTVSGSFSNLAENSFGIAYIDGLNSGTLIDSLGLNDTNFTISDVPEGIWDLVAVEWSGSTNPSPSRVGISRGINVNNNLTGLLVSFVDNSLVEYAFNVDNGNEGSKGVSFFVSKNNTLLVNGGKEENETTGKWYRIQNVTLEDEDSYIFVGENINEDKTRIEAIPAKNVAKQAKTIDLTHITPLTSGSFNPTEKKVTGLTYTPAQDSPNLRGYDVEIGDNNLGWEFVVSKGWLGNNTSYTLPDLSGINGFNSLWWFSDLASTDVSLYAYMSDVEIDFLINQDERIETDYPIFRNGVLEVVSQELQ